jgi:hypothetical protein
MSPQKCIIHFPHHRHHDTQTKRQHIHTNSFPAKTFFSPRHSFPDKNSQSFLPLFFFSPSRKSSQESKVVCRRALAHTIHVPISSALRRVIKSCPNTNKIRATMAGLPTSPKKTEGGRMAVWHKRGMSSKA